MTEVGAAWLAAAIDGEGSIFVHAERRRPDRAFDFSLGLSISVTNTFRGFSRRACALAEAGNVTSGRGRRTVTGKRVFVWRTKVANDVRHILERCQPYLTVKREKARLVLRYLRYAAKLRTAPLRDAPRTARTGVAVEAVVRRRLPNRGQRLLAKWLLRYWFPRFQQGGAAARICRAMVRRTPLRTDVLTYRGATKHVSEWARLRGLAMQTLCSRLRAGWSPGEALDKPVQERRKMRR